MTSRRLVAALLVLAVVLVNAAFAGLGSVFEYPDILQENADEILEKFRADEGSIIVLFSMLALGAALLGPIAVILGRIAGNDLGRWSTRVEEQYSCAPVPGGEASRLTSARGTVML